MGMALPNPKYDEQFAMGNLQVDVTYPPVITPAPGIPAHVYRIPRLRLWDMGERWLSLPMTFRRIIAAGMVLAIVGSFSASTLIKTELAKAQVEKARYTHAGLQDKLDEIDGVSSGAGGDFIFIGKGAK